MKIKHATGYIAFVLRMFRVQLSFYLRQVHFSITIVLVCTDKTILNITNNF